MLTPIGSIALSRYVHASIVFIFIFILSTIFLAANNKKKIHVMFTCPKHNHLLETFFPHLLLQSWTRKVDRPPLRMIRSVCDFFLLSITFCFDFIGDKKGQSIDHLNLGIAIEHHWVRCKRNGAHASERIFMNDISSISYKSSNKMDNESEWMEVAPNRLPVKRYLREHCTHSYSRR